MLRQERRLENGCTDANQGNSQKSGNIRRYFQYLWIGAYYHILYYSPFLPFSYLQHKHQNGQIARHSFHPPLGLPPRSQLRTMSQNHLLGHPTLHIVYLALWELFTRYAHLFVMLHVLTWINWPYNWWCTHFLMSDKTEPLFAIPMQMHASYAPLALVALVHSLTCWFVWYVYLSDQPASVS